MASEHTRRGGVGSWTVAVQGCPSCGEAVGAVYLHTVAGRRCCDDGPPQGTAFVSGGTPNRQLERWRGGVVQLRSAAASFQVSYRSFAARAAHRWSCIPTSGTGRGPQFAHLHQLHSPPIDWNYQLNNQYTALPTVPTSKHVDSASSPVSCQRPPLAPQNGPQPSAPASIPPSHFPDLARHTPSQGDRLLGMYCLLRLGQACSRICAVWSCCGWRWWP